MLIYHERNDVFHCIFRLLSILSRIDGYEIEIDRLKIIDFYIVFPHLMDSVNLPRMTGSKAFKNKAKKLPAPYESLPSNKVLFSEMGDFQLQAIDIIRAQELIDFNEEGNVIIGRGFFDESVRRLIKESKMASNDFYSEMIDFLMWCPLYGSNGLKNRTGLMEYRYDAV